ncbi:hypothetical protein [Nonomuraea sp. H19]
MDRLLGLRAEPVALVVEALPRGGQFLADCPGVAAGLGGGLRGVL